MEYLSWLISSSVFLEYFRQLGYLGIFIFFITVDQLTPIPEEITLLTIGYLASQGVFNPIFAGIVSVAAFLTVDSVYYFLSLSGNKIISNLLSKKNNSIITKYKEKLKTHFGITLFALCFIPRMRLFGPVLAGIMKFSFRKFLFFDLLGLTIFTLIYLSLGMIFHKGLHYYFAELEIYRHMIFAIAMLLLSILIIIFITKTQQK